MSADWKFAIIEQTLKENEKTRKKIKKFLQGDTKEVMDSLQARMLEASENLQFEKAQRKEQNEK